MTTLVYHLGILATDSLASSAADFKHKFSCLHCGKDNEVITLHRDVQKIGLNMKHLFRGEKMLAVAGAGKSADIDSAAHLLRSGANLETFYKNAFVYDRNLLIGRDYTLMIITERKGYLFQTRLTKNGYFAEVIKEFELNETVCYGSGSSAANLAIALLKCTAIEAIIVAAATDEHSGLPVQFVDLNESPLPRNPNYFTEVTDAKQWLRSKT